jgi:hypothetical protein
MKDTTEFRVVLEIRFNGSPCGATDDVIEAPDAETAERAAIEQWKAVRPDRTFHQLLTTTTTRRQSP